jgi:tetratricopeptide (TPR) repeat protein/photosystem II stability/assembly factor-like uncharacterized protein
MSATPRGAIQFSIEGSIIRFNDHSRKVEAVAEKINPYIAGAPVVEARMFFGREETFSWMARSLAGKYVDHILVIHGQRRVGKTSVLKHLSSRLPEQYIPIFIDLQGRVSTTLDRFLWWLAREITRGLKEQEINLPRPNREAFSQDADHFETQFLPLLEEKLGDRRLLLTFDEFDTLSSTAAQEGLALPFLAILKRMMDHENLNFIFSIGSSGRKLENMQATYTAFFKQALYKKISFLDWEDARELIVKPVEGILTYDEEAVGFIYELTSGHPYFIQLVCHELFSTCQKTDTWQVSKVTVEEVLDSVIERGTVNLKFVWDEAANLEKWVLASLAIFESGTDQLALEEHLRAERVRFTRQDLETALVNLREKDVITQENRFVIHLMRLWLRQNRSMEQVRDELEEVDPIVSRFLEIGQEYHDTGEYEQAIGAFERALEAGPHNLEARQGLGAALLALGDYGKAANEFEAALELTPDDVATQAGYCEAYMALGVLEVSFNRLEEGEYAYRKVLQVNPKHTDGLKRMAGIHHRRAVKAIIGGKDAALLEIEKARRFAPEESLFISIIDELIALSDGEKTLAQVLRIWGDITYEQGLWDEAADLYHAFGKAGGDLRSVAEQIEDSDEKIRRKRISAQQGHAERITRLRRHDEAIQAWQEVLTLNPPNTELIQQKIIDLKTEIERLREATTTAVPPKPIWRNIWLWAGLVLVILLAVWLAQPTSPLRVALADPTSTPSQSPAVTFTPTATIESIPSATVIPTDESTPAPTPIPLEWSRVDSGQFLERDTVLSIAIDSNDADVIYVGLENSGIFKTINGGLTWQPIQAGLGRGRISSITIDPTDSFTVYAGSAPGYIYKSANGGESWENISGDIVGWPFEGTSSIIVDPDNNQHVLYLDYDEVYESFSGGHDWSQIKESDCPKFKFDHEIDPYDFQVMYAYNGQPFDCARGIYKSLDGGRNWELVGLEGYPLGDGGLTIGKVDQGSNIYVATEEELYLSSDGGSTWQKILNEWCRNIAISSTDSSVVYCNSWEAVWRSSNNGQSWREMRLDPHLRDVIAVSPLDSDVVFLGRQGFFKSIDGGISWEESSAGLGALPVTIKINPKFSNSLYLNQRSSEQKKIFRSEGTESNWVSMNVGGEGFVFSPTGLSFYRYQGDSIFEYDLDGQLLRHLVAPNSNIGGIGVNPLSPEHLFLIGHTNNNAQIFYSDDNGENWSKSDGVEENEGGISPTNGTFFFFDDGETIFVIIASRYPGYSSTDGGKSWSPCEEYSVGWVDGTDTILIIDPQDSAHISVATQGWGVIESFNHCTSWVQSRYWESENQVGTETEFINSIVIDPNNPERLFMGTEAGVFISEDGGLSWGQVNDGLLGALVIYSIAIDPNNPDNVYASTPYGIFKLEDR